MSKAPNVPLFPVCHVAFICSCFLKKPQDKKLYIRNAIDDLPYRSQKGSSKKKKRGIPPGTYQTEILAILCFSSFIALPGRCLTCSLFRKLQGKNMPLPSLRLMSHGYFSSFYYLSSVNKRHL